MLSFKLDALTSKELFKDVLIRLVKGNELTLNYFELKSVDVSIPFHKHPVEHFVYVLDGEIEFKYKDKKLIIQEKMGFFLPAKTIHSARVIRAPVRALEIFTVVEDEYYKK
jgi:quercetin dioxygenase-like cupin family protein